MALGTSAQAQQRAFVADISFVGSLNQTQVLAADSLLQTLPYDALFIPELFHLTLTHTSPFIAEDVVVALKELGMYAGLERTNFRTAKAGTPSARNVSLDDAKRAWAEEHPNAYQSYLKTREEQLRAAADTSAFYRQILERRESK